MKILFDQGTPVPLRKALTRHAVSSAFEQGWNLKQNGELLKAAEDAAFDAIITTDQNLRYQQNLKDRRLAILVLMTTNWRKMRDHTQYIVVAVDQLRAGDYRELRFPPA